MRCVEGECHAEAVAWLTFTVDGQRRSWPFCARHVVTVTARARRRRPDVPIVDKRRHGNRWSQQ